MLFSFKSHSQQLHNPNQIAFLGHGARTTKLRYHLRIKMQMVYNECLWDVHLTLNLANQWKL